MNQTKRLYDLSCRQGEMLYIHQIGHDTLGCGLTIDDAITDASESGFEIERSELRRASAHGLMDGDVVIGTAQQILEFTGDKVGV